MNGFKNYCQWADLKRVWAEGSSAVLPWHCGCGQGDLGQVAFEALDSSSIHHLHAMGKCASLGLRLGKFLC